MKFAVFHDRNPSFNVVSADVKLANFRKVAEVECEELGDVFRVTNHIDEPWWKNSEVVVADKSARSTSVGDLVITSDGLAYLVDSVGWKEAKVLDAWAEWKRVWSTSNNDKPVNMSNDFINSNRG